LKGPYYYDDGGNNDDDNNNNARQHTAVLTNYSDIENKLNHLFSNIHHKYDTCMDFISPSVRIINESMRKHLIDAVEKKK
jgi:hypothetical protein